MIPITSIDMQGRILFDDNGTIIHHRLRLRQYLLDGMLQQVAIDRYLTIDRNAKFLENGNITRERFAYLDRTANYTFVFEPGFNDHEVFPGKLSLQAHNIIIVQYQCVTTTIMSYRWSSIGWYTGSCHPYTSNWTGYCILYSDNNRDSICHWMSAIQLHLQREEVSLSMYHIMHHCVLNQQHDSYVIRYEKRAI